MRTKRLAALLAGALAFTAVTTGHAFAAAPTIVTACDPGSSWTAWSYTHKAYVITHENDKYNNTGITRSYSITEEVETVVTAGAEATFNTSEKTNVVIGKMEVAVGLNLHYEHASTKKSSITSSFTIPSSDHLYIFYNGTRKAWGKWSHFHCDSAQSWHITAYKKVKSFSGTSDGSIRCDKSTTNGLAKLAKKKYCF
ncbi:hypothetical protein [Streptomyces sp. NPDC001137]|uniref:hypothetical protein n=1 Tax=Streptomyces sp. NPDC001137 TaxID=3154378 RepID=UPI00331A809F